MKTDITMVFEGKPLDANYIKNILEENGISCLLRDNMKGQLYPLYVTYGWIKPVKVFVKKKDQTKAKELIETLFKE